MGALLEKLEAERTFACRLEPDRALETLGEAHGFLVDRGMLTLMPGSRLPSLFGACHEEPYMPGKRGFAQWPKTKYPWAFELRVRPDVHVLKIHRGKELYLSDETVPLAAALCAAELSRAEAGEYGNEAQRLVAHLEQAGPALPEEVKEELGFDTKRLHSVRRSLERVGAIVSRGITLPTAGGGHRHSSELQRWDQAYSRTQPSEGGLPALVVAAVSAAVLAPESEARRWFSWPVPAQLVEDLVEAGRLERPEPGWLAAG